MEEFWKAMLDIALKVGSYISGVNTTRETNATNLKIARETNEAQTEIHREDNAFNAAEAEKAREFNSIGSQLERGREAGVSDWFTLGQPSSSTTSASASNMPGLAVPQMQNPFAQIGASPLDLAGSLKSLADAKKAGAETKEIETLLGLKVDEAQQDIIAKKLQNELTQMFGAGIQQSTLDKMCADIAHLEQLAREASTNADLNLEKKALIQLEQVTERYKSKLSRQQYKIAKKDVASYRARLEADLRVKESEVGRNQAQANESNSVAQFNREMATRVKELLPGEKNQQIVSQALLSAQTSATWEQISKSATERSKIAHEMAILSLQAQHLTLETHQIKMYQDRYEEILDNAIEMDRRTNNQLRQDYHNVFKYVGSILGGTGAAAVTQAGQVKPGPVQVSGFRP